MPHIIFPTLIDVCVAFRSFGGFLDGVINHAFLMPIEAQISSHFPVIQNELLSTFFFFRIIFDVGSCILHSLLQFWSFMSLKHIHEHPLSNLLVFLLLLPSYAITTKAISFLGFQSFPSYQPVNPFLSVVIHLWFWSYARHPTAASFKAVFYCSIFAELEGGTSLAMRRDPAYKSCSTFPILAESKPSNLDS